MAITFNYNDQDLLTTVNVGSLVDFSITASSDDPLYPITVTNSSFTPPNPNFTIENVGVDTIRIHGTTGDELHNASISCTYVTQGESDLMETPIQTSLASVPSFKEVYAIDASVPQIVQRFSLTVTSETAKPETLSITVHIDIVYIFDALGAWVNDYFTNRY